MRDGRAAEYQRLIDEIVTDGTGADPRTIARWRREWRRIDRRDYFRAPGRNEARIAINDLAARETTIGAEQ